MDLDVDYSFHVGDEIKVGKEIWKVYSATLDALTSTVNLMCTNFFIHSGSD